MHAFWIHVYIHAGYVKILSQLLQLWTLYSSQGKSLVLFLVEKKCVTGNSIS